MLKKTRHLDELQLLKRGNVFKHGLFTLMGLLLINALLYFQGIEWASGKWAELTIILFVIVLCNIELILYDIYPFAAKRQKYFIYFSGLIGAAALVRCVCEMLAEKIGIIVDGKIVSSALGAIYGLMFAAIFIVYKLKKKFDAKHENNE